MVKDALARAPSSNCDHFKNCATGLTDLAPKQGLEGYRKKANKH